MLAFVTVLIMLAVAYVYTTEDLSTACFMFCNVMAASLVTANFWEPVADLMEPAFAGSFIYGYEDAFTMVFFFSLSLGLMRLATNNVANAMMEFPPLAHRIGGAVFGLLTGYVTAGFLVCVLQTLPWHENFMYFEAKYEPGDVMRSTFPSDRAWLALMRRAGAYTLANNDDPTVSADDADRYKRYKTFDKNASFELRYARYRRYTDTRKDPMPYYGEFDRELYRH